MKWISVKDELPERKKKVLVWCTGYFKCDNRGKPVPCVRIGFLREFDDHFQVATGNYWLKVSHWMPLPEPPE